VDELQGEFSQQRVNRPPFIPRQIGTVVPMVTFRYRLESGRAAVSPFEAHRIESPVCPQAIAGDMALWESMRGSLAMAIDELGEFYD
jgi:hypothetical protein